MKTKRSIFLGLMLSVALSLLAQLDNHLAYRRYTTQDGLPQMQAERLWQDSRGYIYIGTLSGFVRFDGRSLTPFLKGRRENIVAFAESNGQVRGLGFRRQWLIDDDETEMRPLDPQGHWQLNNLNAGSLPNGYFLMENEQEQHRRLCRMTAEGFAPRLRGTLLDEMTPDRKLYIDSLGIFIPTPGGLYLVKTGNRSRKVEDKREGKRALRLTAKGDIYTLLRTDTMLLAFAADGIYAVEGYRLRLLLKADWSQAAFGLTVRKLQSVGLTIADEHTVYHYDGTTLQQLVTGINLIRDIMVDRWGRLWIATYQGVYCFFNGGFTNHRLTDQNDIVRAVVADEDNRLVMGTLNGKVLTLKTSDNKEELPGDAIEVLSDDDSQYYGTSAVSIGSQTFIPIHGDVACIEGNELHSLGLPQDRYRFLSKKEGRLIMVTQKGTIAAYNPSNGQIDTLTTDIPYPWCAAFDAEGRLWAGGTLGVYSLSRNGKVEKADYPQRLLVTTMEADNQGTIFFASADSLFMIHEGRVKELNSQCPQLSGHEVRQLHVSPRAYLVIAAVDGLLVCRIGKDYRLEDTHFFDHRNGFTMLEPLMGTMAETSDGTIWLPGVEEMTSFRPADQLAYSEEDTYISPLPRWWQHWWVWLTGLVLLTLAVWAVARWYEKLRNRKKMIRLQGEKLAKERQIEHIRQKAIEANNTDLAKDIVKLTERHEELRLTLRTASGTIVVDIADIAYFKGDGNYSQIVTFYTHDTVLTGLGALERMLDPGTFVRADRSTLVNIHNVSSLLPKQRRCIFRSPQGQEVETTLLAPAFKRLQILL